MAAVEPYTDPYLAIFRRVPPAADGVCLVCHSGPGPGYQICYSCGITMGQVSRPVTSVLPISLYEVPGQYHHILRYYKDHRDADVRARLAVTVSATVARFTFQHWACVASLLGGEPSLVTTVPSTRPVVRSGEHPLVAVVRRSPLLARLYRPTLRRGPGEVGRQLASDNAFTVIDSVEGHRVLVIEDTFTTGARAQSAASALRLAGAESVAVVPAGRVINPAWNENCQQIWRYARGREFRFDECAVCSPRV